MPRVYCPGVVERWLTPTLGGGIVRLEPLAWKHADDLWEASRDPRVWRWLPIVQPQTRNEWQGWVDDALGRVADGLDLAFATVLVATGEAVGSTRFLALRPEHRSLEIGWTWLAPAAWSTGANTEAKLLQLEHAFDVLGCRRVEFKTDALNERARPALAALPAVFEGIHRKHMLVRDGQNRDSAWYSVIDDEWPVVREALSERVAAA
jgi:N-acetyltransferase